MHASFFMTLNHRELYDQDFLDADCDPNVVPFDEQNGIDNTLATYSTNYAIAALVLFFAFLIHPKRRQTQQTEDKEYVGTLMFIYFVGNAISFGLAGIGHQVTTEEDEIVNQYIVRIVSFFANVASFALIRISLVYLTKFEGCTRALWWVIATAVTIYGAIVALENFMLTGIPGLLSLLLMLFTNTWQWCKSRNSAVFLKALGMLLYFIGGALQTVLAPTCGYDGYPDCFRDCPLPAPTFNHNALFHVFVLLAIAFFGLGEYMKPASDCVSILRPTTESDSRKDSPDDGMGIPVTIE